MPSSMPAAEPAAAVAASSGSGQHAEQRFGAGDTFLFREMLQGEDASITIDDVLAEVQLGPLFHDNGQILSRPGAFVVAPVEGSAASTKPYLRCPSSVGVVPCAEGPIMRKLRLAASRVAGVEFNHAKVQLYETRMNHIAFHADKVLDLCEDDAFVSFRLGATRTFGLRSKADPKLVHDLRATNNSAIVIGPKSNREWTHGVLPDKRDALYCSPDELTHGERSLSIVFRRAVTFWRGDGLLFGEGARFKTEEALESALRSAEARGEGREAVTALGTKQEKLHKKILAAWGMDNKSWSASRSELYAPIIEGSVLWERTPAMDAKAEALSVATSPSGCEEATAAGARRSGPHLQWVLLPGLAALCFSVVAARVAASPADGQIEWGA
mmetsp:Transcript_44779/g.114040  ORF Transcript_44779/g.114040 Transcript_44779/m.114040 type:complete len:384 (-) Transcript_44779:277-1428(-)